MTLAKLWLQINKEPDRVSSAQGQAAFCRRQQTHSISGDSAHGSHDKPKGVLEEKGRGFLSQIRTKNGL